MGMKNKQLAKEIAERRMGMIAPLIGALSSQEEYYEKRREISVMYEISTRTIQRYVDAYNEFGMDGLEPKGKVRGRASLSPRRFLQKRSVCAVKCRPAACRPLSRSWSWRARSNPVH